MNATLWVVQIALAVLFLGSGIAKSIMSQQRMLETGQTGAAALPLGFVRCIAICEIFGATGLIFPWRYSLYPLLTPLAAAGLAIIMVGAAIVHYRISDYRPIAVNAILFLLCVCVALGRR